IRKDDRGKVELLEGKERHLLGTAVGTARGGLIGVIGGRPGGGAGGLLGASSGMTGDAITASLDDDFVDSVTKEMRPGMTAIIVEADEKSTRPVDDVVKLSGGHVYRQAAERVCDSMSRGRLPNDAATYRNQAGGGTRWR